MSSYFYEEQRFRKPGIWILLTATLLPTNGIMLYGFYQQIILGEAWGSNPTSDTALIIIILSVLFFTLAIVWFIYSIKLVVEIKDKSVYYQLRPLFGERVLSLYDVNSWEIKPIRPIRDFGGYGLRITPKTKGYIISGKHALFLRPNKGKQIAIDTNKVQELELAMKKAWPGSTSSDVD